MEIKGDILHNFAKDLFPITRSITGPGVRETLLLIRNIIPELEIKEIPSGYKAFDWDVPEEWFIHEAFIEDVHGNKIVDFKINNLHVLGYSEPVDKWMGLDELDKHLHSIPDQPDAIPFVTSYYKKRWGFCLTHNQRNNLTPGEYHAVIKSEHKDGILNYGEVLIPGNSQKEIFLSTYICHPSLANNEISGPVITTYLTKWISALKKRKYSYRIIFIPETIGSITYLSINLEHLKSHVIAGFNVTCIGDDRCYSYLPSRAGDTLSDRAAQHTLKYIDPHYKRYTWLDRGSDERQYCSPGIDLPIATIMRSKYGEYPEYHTSLDDLTLVTPSGLEGGFHALKTAIEVLEYNCRPLVKVLGEPQLGKRGLYPTIFFRNWDIDTKNRVDLLSYSDGERDLLEIAEIINTPISMLYPLVKQLVEFELIELIDRNAT